MTFLSSLVSAHSGLKNSTPENGAMLKKLPEQVILEFTSQVKLIKLQYGLSDEEVNGLIGANTDDVTEGSYISRLQNLKQKFLFYFTQITVKNKKYVSAVSYLILIS